MKTKQFLSFLILFSFTTAIWAKKDHTFAKFANAYNEGKCNTAYYLKSDKIHNATQAQTYLIAYLGLDEMPNTDLHLLYEKNSPLGKHYTFEQTFKGLPIFHSTVKINVNKKGEIISVSDFVFDTRQLSIDKKNLTKEKAQELTQQYFFFDKAYERIKEEQWVWFFDNDGEAKAGVLFGALSAENHHEYEVILGIEGAILYGEEKSVHYCEPLVEDAKGMVFLPDPLTSAEQFYGGAYTDQNDQDVAVLNAERVEVDLEVEATGGFYRLENNYLKIVDDTPPNFVPATSTDGTFFFTRSESGFEDVNAFYHITTIQKHIQSLGLNELASNRQVRVDTHGTSDDNSFFSPGTFSIKFGDGGVDDAEDADVIVHEYMHALSEDASPNTNWGNERQALDEALGDYLATSYSRNISEFAWDKMFTWDGHNDAWPGRNMVNNKHYPEDVDNSIYVTSEIFSAALMEIWERLGREVMDAIVLNSLYLHVGNMELDQAAEDMIAVEEQLFDGEYSDVLKACFHKRGLVELDFDAGLDQSACLGDTVTLGTDMNLSCDHLNISWSGNILDGEETFKPRVIANNTTEYILTIEDQGTGEIYTDAVNLFVDICFDGTVDKVSLFNTLAFAQGWGNPFLVFPENTETVEVQLVDVGGRVLFEATQNSSEILRVNGQLLPKGIYILKVMTNDEEKTFKMLKGS